MKTICLSCGAHGEAHCCDNPRHVKAGDAAKQAIEENPGMTDRAIAAKIGVGHETVRRARPSVVPNEATEKRTGKDGKSYKAKKPSKPQITESQRTCAACAVIDDGQTIEEAAAEFTGGSIQIVKTAIEKEKGRREATFQVDPKALSMNAQERLQSAIKQAVCKLEAEYERRVQDGIKQAINDTVLPHYNKKMEEFDEVIKSRKGVLTNDEFKLILSCLHPDQSASPERLREAFNMFKSHELSLRGEKEMPTSSFVMPRNYADLMKMREEVKAKRKAQRHTARNLPGVQ